ncbi:hypothetical protein [Litorihabitans aurantiacus]|uniref:Uncharacterized protein n=1 Tax=Litorihabitans aurantiacus TaxID=1930061 RepID=A0AA37UW38_9MICO|nr:hypothetical protein [Litorihabitans aurantiacus]GMA30052.1 hypothetical protein GCM10025875_00440 [Litorihabitans aurantiacus]GMA33550.1 hypothetical protein GCM10025875_35420 [Litorihabitans aurantiacus]
MTLSVRGAIAGAVSVLAVAGMLASVGYREASRWSGSHPVAPASAEVGGEARTRGVTIGFRGIEEVDRLNGSYGDPFLPPDGWQLWEADFTVDGAPPSDDGGFGVDLVVLADDGATYTRSRLISTSVEPEGGWLGSIFLVDGSRSDVVLLPDGVEPRSVRVVPTDTPRRYWSFDL